MIDFPSDRSAHGERQRISDDQLRTAIRKSRSWRQVLRCLGYSGQSGYARQQLQDRASQLGFDTGHFVQHARPTSRVPTFFSWNVPAGRRDKIREAAPAIAQAWFLLRGYTPSVPSEPRPYDLVVKMAEGWKQVQVKTSTSRGYNDDWQVAVSKSPTEDRDRAAYEEDAVDLFFIIDGDLSIYLVPAEFVRGKLVITLGESYQRLRVGSAASLMA